MSENVLFAIVLYHKKEKKTFCLLLGLWTVSHLDRVFHCIEKKKIQMIWGKTVEQELVSLDCFLSFNSVSNKQNKLRRKGLRKHARLGFTSLYEVEQQYSPEAIKSARPVGTESTVGAEKWPELFTSLWSSQIIIFFFFFLPPTTMRFSLFSFIFKICEWVEGREGWKKGNREKVEERCRKGWQVRDESEESDDNG